jgi:hypothetical protein
MPAPVVAAAVTVVKSEAVKKAVEGLQGLFGDTPTDKARAAHASSLLNAALNGDTVALRQLAYEAFEPRRGLAGDARTPRDGKHSPDAVRTLARRALQRYVNAGGKLPASMNEYTDRIGAPIAPENLSIAEELATAAADAAGERAATAAAMKAGEGLKKYLPVVLVLAVLAVAMYAASRRTAA